MKSRTAVQKNDNKARLDELYTTTIRPALAKSSWYF